MYNIDILDQWLPGDHFLQVDALVQHRLPGDHFLQVDAALRLPVANNESETGRFRV